MSGIMLSRAEVKRLRALGRRKGREESGLFLAEGVRLVEELLDSEVVLHSALLAPSLEDTGRGALLARRLHARVRTIEVSEKELAQLAGTDSPQGVLVVAGIPEASLERLQPPEAGLLVVLDGVQDPGNFGTIVRSAEAFSAHAVAALPGTVDPWNAKSVRAAMGSSLRVPIVESAPDGLGDWLREHRYTVLAADAEGQSVEEIRVQGRVALVLGNEGAGLGDDAQRLCTGTVAIPIRGRAESLNVGVAAGILLYLLARQL